MSLPAKSKSAQEHKQTEIRTEKTQYAELVNSKSTFVDIRPNNNILFTHYKK